MPLQPCALLEPVNGERPTAYADRIGRIYSASTSTTHKKQFGQYLTPVDVADFLASLVDCEAKDIHILDPGAGSGVLACAVGEAIAGRARSPRRLFIDAYESDQMLLPVLDQSLQYLATELRRCDISVEYRAIASDFVLEHASELRQSKSLFRSDDHCTYDVIISNPPYFKLPKSDLRARAADDIVHGQPNIYALFMAIAAALLKPDGEMVFITPRSFASGHYFRRFRERFFARIQPQEVHVFDSRRDAFNRDSVLQENVILKGRFREHWAEVGFSEPVRVSVSHGTADLASRKVRTVQLIDLIDMKTPEKMLRIPLTRDEHRLINRVDEWTALPSSYGMQISTGPVVPFRAVELLSLHGEVPERHAPLLWLQNVHPMRIDWPASARGKPQYISTVSQNAIPLLLRDRNYVLLRRFSAKEERRRLVAAPLLARQLGSDWIGVENHLNYVHRPGGSLTEEESLGLAIIYNSKYMDIYFRVLNGSTQVSATEIRRIPLPSLDVIVEIGDRAKGRVLNLTLIDELAQIAFEDRPRFHENKLTHA